MSNPSSRDHIELPDGYRLESPSDDGLLDWSGVEEQLVESLHYWMATTRPDGRPHVVPRWGVWIGGRLYYDGSPETVHARNLRRNPACTLHIGDGREALIVEGRAEPSEPLSAEAGRPVATEIGRKYGDHGYSPGPDSWSGADAGGLVVFRPVKALVWNDFPTDLTRFHF